MNAIEPLLTSWQERGTSQLFIGIGGGSGSGKTLIAQAIEERLAALDILLVNQDRFFKPAAELPTFYSEFMGRPYPDFNRPDSFKTGEMFAFCQQIGGHDVVILEGILALYYPELRRLMDIKCYVTAPLDEMLIRRTSRNLAAGYGGPYEEIAHYNLECVVPQHGRYNAPTQRFADILIPNGPGDEERRDKIVAQLCGKILEYNHAR
jgi:uridine kinase